MRALLNAMRHRPTVALPLDSVAVVCRRITHIVNLSGLPRSPLPPRPRSRLRPFVVLNRMTGFELQLRAYGASGCDVYKAHQLLLHTRMLRVSGAKRRRSESRCRGRACPAAVHAGPPSRVAPPVLIIIVTAVV